VLVCVVCVFVWEGSEFAAYEFLLCVFEFVCVSGGGVIVQQVALFCVCLSVCVCVCFGWELVCSRWLCFVCV